MYKEYMNSKDSNNCGFCIKNAGGIILSGLTDQISLLCYFLKQSRENSD